MELDTIVIVPKATKYEVDLVEFKFTPAQLLEKYEKEGVDIKKILDSHHAQKKALARLKEFFKESQFVQRDSLNKEIVQNATVVISFGGDNHFQYISHYLDSVPILGINSDPSRSLGALNQVTMHDIEKIVKRLQGDDFKTEEWTRLASATFGRTAVLTTSEVFLGENRREYMSRHVLTHREQSEEQKCSGLIVATGAGSTGWYDSVCRYLHTDGTPFPRTEKRARFVVTEPFRGAHKYSLLEGVLEEGEVLKINSLNDRGTIVIDAIDGFSFSRGTRATVKIADKPLRVIQFS